MMFDVMRSRSLRAMTIVAALSLAVALGGCSSLKKKPVIAPGGGDTATIPGPGTIGDGGALNPIGERPIINTPPVEFEPSAGVRDVQFDYDSSEIRRDQMAILDRNIEYFKAHPEVRIMVEGHTDERGTVEYNIALGQRRAAAVQEYLLKSGIAADRLATISKGKESPAVDGHGESAWARNRRAHFMKMQ